MHRALGRASLARRFCVFRLWRTAGLAAEGSTAGLRVQHLPSAGIGDGGNGVSSHADRSLEMVSCRLPDGPRQARRLGQVSAAGTGGGVSDGLDHGAQAAPRAERGSGPSAARLSRGGRDLHRRPRRSEQSRTQHGQPRQEPGRRRRREGAGAEEQERQARSCRQASARLLCRRRPDRRAAGRNGCRTRRLSDRQTSPPGRIS